MNESLLADAEAQVEPAPEETPKKKQDSFVVFLLKLVVIVLLFRTLLFTSFMIPSESMMPRLLVGDYLFASKWPYGYSQASMPFDLNIVPGSGRVFGSLPERGDVVIFKHPIDRTDYVKRVIGLPGDTVQMVGGQLVLNGKAVPKDRVGDFVIPLRVDEHCRGEIIRQNGASACRYTQFRETLPSGVSYNVFDLGVREKDSTEPLIVPEGQLFLMGDNRDNSMDSRFPAVPGEGIGLVPYENLVGEASFMFFSTTSSWSEPSTWLSGIRWGRIGRGI